MVDRYQCGGRHHQGCGAVFHFKHPEVARWMPDPGPCPVTGIYDPERGSMTGDPHPTCPRCGSKYVMAVKS